MRRRKTLPRVTHNHVSPAPLEEKNHVAGRVTVCNWAGLILKQRTCVPVVAAGRNHRQERCSTSEGPDDVGDALPGSLLMENLPLVSGCVSRDSRTMNRHPGSCVRCGDDRSEAAVASGVAAGDDFTL